MNRSQQLVLGFFAFAWVALVMILVVGTRNSLPQAVAVVAHSTARDAHAL